MEGIGERIVELRKLRGWGQAEMGRRAGIKHEYLSKLENEHLKNPTPDTIYKIAHLFWPKSKPMTAVANFFGGGNSTRKLRKQLEVEQGLRKDLQDKVGLYVDLFANISQQIELARSGFSAIPEQPPCARRP